MFIMNESVSCDDIILITERLKQHLRQRIHNPLGYLLIVNFNYIHSSV